MSTEVGGLTAAIADEAAKHAPLPTPDDVPGAVIGGGTVEQLDMLRDENGKLPPDAFMRLRIQNKSGPGRREGSRNMRNRDAAKLMVQQYGDPLQVLGRIYAMPLDQLVEMVLIAEGVPEREDRLLSLCDSVDDLMADGKVNGWSEEKLRVLQKAVFAIEKASSSLKAKPGEIALKALALIKDAAKEALPYVNSKKPVEIDLHHKVDGIIFMPAPQSSMADPVDAAMRATAEAIGSGSITPAQIMDMRFNKESGAFEVPDDDDLPPEETDR